MAEEEIVYSLTRIYNATTQVHYIRDSRSKESLVKNLYIGSSKMFTDIEEANVRLDVATDYLLATRSDRLFWTEILVDQITNSSQTKHIILDTACLVSLFCPENSKKGELLKNITANQTVIWNNFLNNKFLYQ